MNKKDLLAKSKPKRSLLHHTLDVATMAQHYAKRWSHLAALVNDETLFDDLLLAALLHDLGKAASGFQNILEGQEDESWGRYRHELLSAAIVATLPYSEKRQDLLLAVMTHHIGMNDEVNARKSLAKYDDALIPFEERLSQLEQHWHQLEALYKDLEIRFSLTLPILPNEPGKLANPFEALQQSANTRVRSRERIARKLPLRKIFLRGLLVASDHLASAAITEQNVSEQDIVSDLPSLRAITSDGFSFALNQHQHTCADAKGSIFLNAPTGSGKTEASLLWMQANQGTEQSRHIFYVLPFTASINAMYHRLRGESYFGEGAVSLLHGRSAYFTYRWLCEQGEQTRSAAKQSSALRRQTKELYYPIKVLTPHQILMTFLGVKGWEKSLCEYSGGLFILDEIHAYEPNLTGLLFEILRRLTQELGAKVCIMSATFPTLLKKALLEQIGEVHDIELEPTECDRYSRHVINVVEGSIQDYLEDIQEKIHAGLRVLVVLNTVAGAMACFEQLKDYANNPCLIHGRLIHRDRQEAEARLADKTNPVDLLIGTQAIEVSLDIDFDVLYTDPAPLDALLQRFGRVNRKTLYALEQLPSEIRCRDVFVCKEQWPDTFNIYPEQLVTQTLAILPNGEVLKESRVKSLVDQVYNEEQLREFLKTVKEQQLKLQLLIDSLEPGSEKPYSDTDLLDDLIDSIPIIPVRFQEQHQAYLREQRYFDAEDFIFNISKGRYHALNNKAKLQREIEPLSNQSFLYGLFEYKDGIGPYFESVQQQEALIL